MGCVDSFRHVAVTKGARLLNCLFGIRSASPASNKISEFVCITNYGKASEAKKPIRSVVAWKYTKTIISSTISGSIEPLLPFPPRRP